MHKKANEIWSYEIRNTSGPSLTLSTTNISGYSPQNYAYRAVFWGVGHIWSLRCPCVSYIKMRYAENL